ncbi:MAG: hypothetical protein JOZ18_18130 [Chloroflexi bacterium]|nr:hypothetical protein [Chloroflexota bacterium]
MRQKSLQNAFLALLTALSGEQSVVTIQVFSLPDFSPPAALHKRLYELRVVRTASAQHATHTNEQAATGGKRT